MAPKPAGFRNTGTSCIRERVTASFYDQHFVDKYISIRDKYSIPPQLLEIEFTESMVFDNSALLLQTVKRLKDAGFSCSIDDFGKGYSSLGL